MHPHLPADVGQHTVAVVQFHFKHGSGEGIYNFALKNDYVIFCFRQCLDLLVGDIQSRPKTISKPTYLQSWFLEVGRSAERLRIRIGL